MLSQVASLDAVHWHSRAVVIVTRPVPPSAGSVASTAPSVTAQRVIVEGAVAVEVEDPHPTSPGAHADRAAMTRKRTPASRDHREMAGLDGMAARS